jgi:hypothetical protein
LMPMMNDDYLLSSQLLILIFFLLCLPGRKSADFMLKALDSLYMFLSFYN